MIGSNGRNYLADLNVPVGRKKLISYRSANSGPTQSFRHFSIFASYTLQTTGLQY